MTEEIMYDAAQQWLDYVMPSGIPMKMRSHEETSHLIMIIEAF